MHAVDKARAAVCDGLDEPVRGMRLGHERDVYDAAYTEPLEASLEVGWAKW